MGHIYTMATYFIYKICCNNNECTDFYIGSTQNVRKRKSQHKQSCINESSKQHNYFIYTKIREYGGWNNWRMVVIEEVPNATLIQARIREEHYRVELQATLNSKSAYSGLQRKEYLKQYNDEHKEELAEKSKIYRDGRKEEIAEYIKVYRESNKDKLTGKRKEKYENNKQVILEKNKAYRDANKDAIKAKARERWAKKKAEKNAVNLAENNITK